MTNQIELLIHGQSRPAETEATFDCHDPVTGEISTTAAAGTPADVAAAVASSAEAFVGWRGTSPNERRMILLAAADLIDSRVGEFSELMLHETGATGAWAGFNVGLAASMLREAASMTTQISGEVLPANKPGTLAMAVRQPAGVCAAIAPWNAPVILGTRAVAMAISCGNTVVLKASELSPATHRLIAQTLLDAGLPPGVLNVITNSSADAPDVVEALVAHPLVRRVNFTGSTRVGKIIAALAAEHLKPALLELGGKAPMVVLADADIDAAVNAAVFGCYLHQGQICMSTERLVVDEAVADELVDKLAARVASLPAGDPRGHVVLGSLINQDAAERMDALIADALARGATLRAGGARVGTIVEATLLDGVGPDMRIYHEESFGPVKPVIRVSGDDEAVRVANDTEYGLAAAVFSRDIQRALDVAGRIESGICHINGPTVGDEAQMPFGGMKGSGYGRFGGKAAIEAFTDLRWITIEDPQQHYPF